jgi:hypothetical protein
MKPSFEYEELFHGFGFLVVNQNYIKKTSLFKHFFGVACSFYFLPSLMSFDEMYVKLLDSIRRLSDEIDDIKELLAEQNKYRFGDQYLTNEELVDLLKISRRTVQSWRKQGIIPFIMLEKKIYYRLSDLEKMFEHEFKSQFAARKYGHRTKRPSKRSSKKGSWVVKV